MRSQTTIRFAVAGCALCSTLLCAQTPRTQPSKPSATIAATPQPATQPITAPPLLPAEQPAQPATVTYSNGLLTVTAHNSSLNQILRDISHETSMKITGGVADERVFGNYGPEPAAQVLNSLLDGTSSNILLVGSNGPAPAELVLTPRNGGPTPPSTMAFTASRNQQPEQPQPSKSNPNSGLDESAPVNPPETTPQPAPPADKESNQGSDQQSPNGVKTPQDIFNQLMKLRQQNSQPQNNQQQNNQQQQ
ncbi:superantigen-like protein SSL4 [Edaphobacter acidisoli]|nr:hypothetical protein [Edaphobacter acidisoli]